MSTVTDSKGPLSGIRVIDMASVVAGPGSARLLADFGADVIKVEPPGGDATRRLGWKISESDDSLFWKLIGRNKKSVVLDLKSESGRKDMLRLVESAHVLVENMRPGKLEDLGLGPDILLEHNPKIVIHRVTGFGQAGPYAARPGFATLAEAMAGFAAINGEPDGQPLLPPVALTDEIAAMLGAFGIMVALWNARDTGEGQVIDLSLIESMLQIMGPLPAAFAHLDYVQPRLGSGIPYTVPRGTYQCSDGVWVAVSTSSDAVAARVLEMVGLGHEERFVSFGGRVENRAEVESHVAAWIGARASDEVYRMFEEADAAVGPVYTMKDIFSDPHFNDRGVFEEVDGIVMQAAVPRLSRTPGRIRHAGRELGTDTESVLEELGDGSPD